MTISPSLANSSALMISGEPARKIKASITSLITASNTIQHVQYVIKEIQFNSGI